MITGSLSCYIQLDWEAVSVGQDNWEFKLDCEATSTSLREAILNIYFNLDKQLQLGWDSASVRLQLDLVNRNLLQIDREQRIQLNWLSAQLDGEVLLQLDWL